jgi:(E)-4-hydroxy-3-methyl-but-2-enyl pyrophosphate reductase
MKILLAKSSGFCFGVKHAIDMADRLIADPPPARPIYMLGALIHNRQVIRELNDQGMRTADSTDEVEAGSTVLIRAHGVTPATLCELEKKNCNIVNCTCPFVTKIHRIVRQAYLKGSSIIIAGTPGHAEVEGINGECNGEGLVISSSEEAEKQQFSENHWILVAQTTFSFAEYQNICVILKKKIAKLQIFDTICITTEDRQREACEIAKQADMMFVIGSQGSSNTQKLLAICLGQCRWTYLVEDATQVGSMVGERSLRDLTVGITAGASTPERIIREVIQAMTEQEVKQNKQEIQQDVQEEVRQDADQMTGQEDNQEAVAEMAPETGSAEATEQEQPAAEATVAEVPEFQETAQEPEAVPAPEEKAPEPVVQEEKAPEPVVVQEEKAPEPVVVQEEASDKDQEAAQDSGDISFTDFIDNIPHLKRGITVRGTIIRYDNEHVYVDVRDKSEGRIPRHEFDGDPDFDLDEAVANHKDIDVYVRNIRNSDLGKEIILSKARVDFTKYKALIEEAYNDKTPISVKVVNVVKDGVIASYGGVDIYIHRTQLEMGIVEDLEPYRGQTLDILVTQYDPDKKRLRVSGSRRALLSMERRAKADELWQSIEAGNEYNGIVRSLTDFGAFVDIGGVDGLVHVSELSWNRIRHPSEVVNVGDEIHVFVKDFDADRKRISLGYKKTEDDPYHDVESRFPVGSIVRGTVVRMFPFGAFVEIAPGVDALCHISQIANVRLNKPNEVLSEGMEVDARVLEVSNDSRRISISIKEVEPINPPGYEDSHF